MATRQGDTLCFGAAAPVIAAFAAVGGKKESEGPLAGGFDELERDNTFGQKTWEAAERELAVRAARHCLQKAQVGPQQVDLALAGDLQAQCTASGYAMRELGLPFAGLYGACSTMAEALGLGAALCGGGCANGILAMACSHFCASERQFRTPLSYGAVRTPTSQWTATAAGCCLVRPAGHAARGANANIAIKAATFGRVQDLQIKDINNMGAAMAPAAAATLTHYLRDTHTSPQDFDTIYTGDLGRVGSELLAQLLADEGLALPNHEDCGKLLYDAGAQQTHSGGSGAGCCAGVLCSHILPALAARKKRRVLFIATGALMSQTTFLQKESIPTVAHLVELAVE
jgi:stage V sporulation protein AD